MIGARCRAPPSEGTDTLPQVELRRRVCRGPECGIVFYICRPCDRGQHYHDDVCRHRARLAQRRKANREYQASRAAKLDHADRQRAYIERRRLRWKKVTGQGSETTGSSVTIGSALMGAGIAAKEPEPQAQEALHGKPNLFPAPQEASSGLVFCIVCGRSALSPIPMPRSP
jgi:hypothetical protein